METLKVGPNMRSEQTLTSSKWVTRLRRTWAYYVALIPTVLLLAFFGYYPAASGLYHAFYDWHPGFTSPFIGLENFQAMLHDAVFLQSLRNVAELFLFGVTIAWFVPLAAAEAVITLKSARLRFLFRTLLVLPFAFPVVVQVLLWEFIYDPNVGILNSFLHAVGLGSLAQNWLGDPNLALYSLMFINAPWVASLPFLLFLVGLQAIPQEIFDAAALDSANRWQRFLFVDFPMLASQFRLLFILAIIQILQVGVPVALLTNGGPANATQVPVVYMLNRAFFGGDWGYATTLSATLFLIMLALSLIVMSIRSKENTL